MISENEFHALLHAQGKNQTDYYHYHDYYEILFYLGEREVRYEKDNWSTVIRKGDVVFCRMFENHIVDCAENEGHLRFCVGIEPHLLGGFSKKDASLYLLFSNQNPNYPVMHLDMVRMQKYLWMIEEFQQLGNSPGERIIASSIIHRSQTQVVSSRPASVGGSHQSSPAGSQPLSSGPGPVFGPGGPTL